MLKNIMDQKPALILDESKVELFISNGKQGINFYKNVWHHYLMPLENDSEFLIVDRKADYKKDSHNFISQKHPLILVFSKN